MTSWTDKAGHVLAVMPADGLNPARLVIGQAEIEPLDCARFWLDGEADLAEVAVAMFTANGKPAPLILPRPEVNPEVSEHDGEIGVWLSHGGEVIIGMGGFCVRRSADGADKAAALIAGYAQASRSRKPEPATADVERMAGLFTEASRMAPEDAARYLLRKGVTLPGGDGGNG